MRDINDAVLREWPLPEISAAADKTHRGTVLIVAGGTGMAGAALLAGTAALRAGAGRIQILTARQHADAVGIALPEARVLASVERHPGAADVEHVRTGFDAVLIGPGLDERSACAFATRYVERGCTCPVILDAGAIPAVRQVAPGSAEMLLTPHAGELAHLTGTAKDAIQRDPSAAAYQAAQHWSAGVALKGAVTHLSLPESGQWRHEGGNCGLATAGSGDVLAGIIVGLVARGASLEQAAVWGVALHARAGDALADQVGPLGYLARELPAEIPPLLRTLGPAASQDGA